MDYINELELKSLILRIKNSRKKFNTVKTDKTITDNSKYNIITNRKIKKYISLYIKIKKLKSQTDKTKKVLNDLKNTIIRKSEVTCIDNRNYELFGIYIVEMVNKILTKPQFRNYSYYDDFLSDSVYKILKYIDNFDHKKISKITGQPVDSFSYISQTIHNAIIFIINKNKKYNNFISSQMMIEKIKFGFTNNLRLINNDSQEDTNDIMYTVSNDNIDDIISEICTNDKKSVITVFYYDLELEDINRLHSLKKQYKKLKIFEGASDEWRSIS